MKGSNYIAKCLEITARIVMLFNMLVFAVIGCILFKEIAILGILVGGAVGTIVGWFPFVFFMALAQIVVNTERSAVACESNTGSDNMVNNNSYTSGTGKSYSDLLRRLTSDSQIEESWICPVCGEKNKKLDSICKGCGKYK